MMKTRIYPKDFYTPVKGRDFVELSGTASAVPSRDIAEMKARMREIWLKSNSPEGQCVKE
jgi:hypothetical protein